MLESFFVYFMPPLLVLGIVINYYKLRLQTRIGTVVQKTFVPKGTTEYEPIGMIGGAMAFPSRKNRYFVRLSEAGQLVDYEVNGEQYVRFVEQKTFRLSYTQRRLTRERTIRSLDKDLT